MRRLACAAFALACALVALRGVGLYFGRGADALYDGELAAEAALARGVDDHVRAHLDTDDFATGSSRFDGEWLFATRMMAILGYAQTAREHPALRARHAELANLAADGLISEAGRAFDRDAWGHDALADLGSERPHVAYLGYLALALANLRELDPETPHAALEARIIEHLAARLDASPIGLCETYPSEVYPIDNTSFFGALAVHDRVTGEDHRALLDRLLATLVDRYRDPRSGLLYQSVDPDDGAPLDRPRGSGTGLAAYFLHFADPALSRALYGSIKDGLVTDAFGFATVREYPLGELGGGDIDSGPVVLGQGVSATGFTIALARLHGDRATYHHLLATASLVGGRTSGEVTRFALGGPIGDAMLFAMLTAPRETP
ncbi:MAG: hypothetical protein AB7S26_01325 [Sandaracinaceae bacterium]